MSKQDRKEVLKELINDNDRVEFGEFGQGTSQEWVERAENRLGVKFPISYKWWLMNFGGGEVFGDEIFSVYELDFDSVVGGDVVYMNELNRKNGFLKSDQISICENDEGGIFYFDLSKLDEQGEAPVFYDLTGEVYAANFVEFLIKRISE